MHAGGADRSRPEAGNPARDVGRPSPSPPEAGQRRHPRRSAGWCPLEVQPGNGPLRSDSLWPSRTAGLSREIARLQAPLEPHGAVWAVMPKKAFAAGRGGSFSWEEMQAEGLRGDRVDNKVASNTATDYGTRFVIRKERRTVSSARGFPLQRASPQSRTAWAGIGRPRPASPP